jgi:hypothetical protein
MLKKKPFFAALAIVFASALFVDVQAASTPQSDSSSHVIMMVNIMASFDKTIDAKKAKAGDPITAKTTAATALSDGTKVPTGSILVGHIDSVTPSENKGDSTLVLTFDKLQIKNGKELPVKATVTSIASTAPAFGDDKPYDPSSYRPGTQGDNKSNSQNNQNSGPTAPHPIEGLTLSGTVHDATSATLTQAKKNIHLSNTTQLVISVAAAPQ